MEKVFISYMSEDFADAQRLSEGLKERGIEVWLDKESLIPGERWKDSIKNAIRSGECFIACFSDCYHKRDRSYMNEELVLAIEELRMRASNRVWFIPVLFRDCDVPAINIGAGETLLDLHWVNLHLNWDDGIKNISKVILNCELRNMKNELDNLARYIAKQENNLIFADTTTLRECQHKIVNTYVVKYDELKASVFDGFGVIYDPITLRRG